MFLSNSKLLINQQKFSSKGVISVSTEAQLRTQDPDLEEKDEKFEKEEVHKEHFKSSNKITTPLDEIEEERITEENITPIKKKNNKLNDQETLDNLEQPTMRKSFGDKSRDTPSSNHSGEETQPQPQTKMNLEPVDDEEDEHIGSFEEVLQQMKKQSKEEIPVFLFQPNTNEMRQDRMLLPPRRKDRNYTLVLDLDETLIHFEEKPDGTSQFLIRPFAQLFLKQVAQYYEVVIFTAALQDYADYILDRMDTEKCVSHRLYRQHTNLDKKCNVYQKDLSRLGRDLSRTLIVDNNAENFQLQPDNGIYIKSWYDDPADRALNQLAPLLIGNFHFFIYFLDIVKKNYDDVRVALRCLREKMIQNYRKMEKGTGENLSLSLDPQGGKLIK